MSLLDHTTASKGLPDMGNYLINIHVVRRHIQLISIGYYTSHF